MRPLLLLLLIGCGEAGTSVLPETGLQEPATFECKRAPCVPCEDEDEASCAARSDCHPVFTEEEQPCLCDALGCCTSFIRCAGGPASCSDANLGCRRAPPLCIGPFVIGYVDSCYEGCVLPEDCSE